MLREAVGAAPDRSVELLRSALGDATEEERASLIRTLPASRLLKAEGPGSWRALFVLASLGKPAFVVESISSWSFDQEAKARFAQHWDTVVDGVCAGAGGRSDEWIGQFLAALQENSWASSGPTWPIAYGIVRQRGLPGDPTGYLDMLLGEASSSSGDARIAFLRSDPDFLGRDFWATFRLEHLNRYVLDWNNGWTGEHATKWDGTLLALCRDEVGFRDRLLDETLQALLRDFAANKVGWFIAAHRLADPTPAEITSREPTYLALLATAPSTSVGLAQDMLARVTVTDAGGLLDASRTVLTRTEKKLVKAQVALLKRLVKDHPELAPSTSQVVREAMDAMPADIAEQAKKLLLATPVTPTPHQPSASGPVFVDEVSVVIPAPRTADLPKPLDEDEPISAEDEFVALTAEHLEGVGDGANLSRLAAWALANMTRPTSATLASRAKEVCESTWDCCGLSPRLHLADIVIQRQGLRLNGRPRPPQRFTGYETGWPRKLIPTHSPDALCALNLQGVRGVPGLLRRAETPQVWPLPPVTPQWVRTLAKPGEGQWRAPDAMALDSDKPVWVYTDGTPTPGGSPFEERAFDVSPVASEFGMRAQSGRDSDCYEQTAQWTAWLYRHNPDVLAAHYHPLLWAAAQVVNVRGVTPILRALGQSWRTPGGPTYSALTLGLSAKQADHRAVAAESVAALAGSGLLQPDRFAEQIAAHLTGGFITGARLASSLADVASISPLAGYRVLQIMEMLLPALEGVTGASQLVELSARLSTTYGTPTRLPAWLAAKSKGASALAVAVRTLSAVTPTATPLLQSAARS